MAIISDELRGETLFATPAAPRSTDAGDIEDEDLIEREDMVVTITSGGYIKRIRSRPTARRTAAARAGPACRPRTTMSSPLFSSPIHIPVLFFHTLGMVYKMKTWRLPPRGPHRRARRHGQHPADRARRPHRRPRAPCRERGRLGRPPHHLRHLPTATPPEQAFRLRAT